MIDYFIKKSSSLDSKELILSYLEICKNLMFQEEEQVRKAMQIMTKNIRLFAYKNCNFYRSIEKINVIEKSMLIDKSKWFVKGIKSKEMLTNGTSTGNKFYYQVLEETFDQIEANIHYGSILDEFKIKKRPTILCLLSQHLHPQATSQSKFVILDSPKSPLHSHGASDSIVHIINAAPDLNKDIESQFKMILDYTVDKKFDIILTSGPFINSFVYYCKKYNIKRKICNLLSNTCEQMVLEDVLFLKNKNIIENYCDHMRCWDGGASFFTCKYNVYHLMDNLSNCYSDENGRLISTDYFSLSCPFINYWNGDYANIKKEYKRCNCGRLYRDFKFLEPRDFSQFGITSGIIRERISKTMIKGIKYFKAMNRSAEISTNRIFSSQEKKILKDCFPEIPNILFTEEII